MVLGLHCTYGLGMANSVTNPFIDFFNIGGKISNTIRDLYLEISGEEKRRHLTDLTISNARDAERKISNISQLQMLKTQATVKARPKKGVTNTKRAKLNLRKMWRGFGCHSVCSPHLTNFVTLTCD